MLQKGLRTESVVSNEKSAALALQLAVQYEQKPDQAMKVTEAILANPKSSEILKNKARGWQSSVKKWQQEKESPKTLDGTSKLLVNAQTEIESMRALAQILAFLSTEPQQPELGEALLLAGTAYDKLSDFLPSDLHENYYASCIRSQPKSGQAKRCYSKLEESIRFGYTGTSGENLPVEIQVWLGQLKKEADKEAGN